MKEREEGLEDEENEVDEVVGEEEGEGSTSTS